MSLHQENGGKTTKYDIDLFCVNILSCHKLDSASLIGSHFKFKQNKTK